MIDEVSSRIRCRMKLDPMNPAPPVTRIVMPNVVPDSPHCARRDRLLIVIKNDGVDPVPYVNGGLPAGSGRTLQARAAEGAAAFLASSTPATESITDAMRTVIDCSTERR